MCSLTLIPTALVLAIAPAGLAKGKLSPLAASTPIANVSALDKFGLVIGIDSYTNTASLTSSVRDAKEFAQMLQDHFGFDNVVVMTTDTARQALLPNRANINEVLQNFVADLHKDSQVVVFFSGHATSTTGSGSANADWLIPSDGAASDLPGTCINYEDVREALDKAKPGRVLIVCDIRGLPANGKAIGDSSNFGDLALKKHSGPEIIELFACQSSEESQDGDDFPESVFAHYLITGLQGDSEAADPNTGLITYDTLLNYVQTKVSQYVLSHFNDQQTPTGHASEGDIVFVQTSTQALPATPAANGR